MAWGVLEDRRTPRPPGTVPLESKNGASDIESAEEKDLKRRGNTILQPQPTDSPEDPLNWSQKRKYSIFSVIVIAVIATVGISNMLNTGYQILAVDFGINFPTLVKALTPPVYVSVLVGLFLASAIAAVWGKRVQFVGASIIMLFTLLSGCFANSLVYYQIISVFNGLCTAPLELLAAPVTAEMVYVHERGTLSAVASVVAVLGQDIRFVSMNLTIYNY